MVEVFVFDDTTFQGFPMPDFVPTPSLIKSQLPRISAMHASLTMARVTAMPISPTQPTASRIPQC